jgi:hypothetical protein
MSRWDACFSFDLQIAHVSVFSASSGNAEVSEALERAFEIYYHPGEEAPASQLASDPVTITTDGKPVTLGLWRDSSNRYCVARDASRALKWSCVRDSRMTMPPSNIKSMFSSPLSSS